MEEYGLEQVHEELCNILVDFDRVCRENNIIYSLMCGTLLGAVREAGFIPWDDDLDIVMTREAYKRFLVVYPKGCNPIYELSFTQTWVPRVKKRSGNAFLDIFILDGISRNKILSNAKIFILKTFQGMMKKKIQYRNYSFANKILLFTTHCVGRIFPFHTKFSMYQAISQSLFCGNGEYVHMSDGAYNLLSMKWDPDVFTSVTELVFEGREFLVTEKFSGVLTTLYGNDYMMPPPPEKRVVLHLDI